MACGINTDFSNLLSSTSAIKNTILSEAANATGLSGDIATIKSALTGQIGPIAGLLSKVTDAAGLPEVSNLITEITSLAALAGDAAAFASKLSSVSGSYGSVPGLDLDSIVGLIGTAGFDVCALVPNISILSDGSFLTKGSDISFPSALPIALPSLPDVPSWRPPVNPIITEMVDSYKASQYVAAVELEGL